MFTRIAKMYRLVKQRKTFFQEFLNECVFLKIKKSVLKKYTWLGDKVLAYFLREKSHISQKSFLSSSLKLRYKNDTERDNTFCEL